MVVAIAEGDNSRRRPGTLVGVVDTVVAKAAESKLKPTGDGWTLE